jgi:HrpA-like RNA helicase
MSESRAALPAFQHREQLLRTVRDHRLTIIHGATGCGKSTQLPRLLLEDAVGQRLEECSIIVAQPRRLAATALADRVSAEMGDTIGGLCGYRIRGDARVGAATALTYVTTGVLLRQLESDPLLTSASHIVVDEVHERGIDTDLLLLVLRRALRAGTTAKVVLMSATIDTASFSQYFASCAGGSVGTCVVPGRSYPVVEYFLERAVADAVGAGFSCAPSSEWAREVALSDDAALGASSRAAAEASIAAEAAAAARLRAEADGGTAAAAMIAANLEARALKLQNAAASSAASKSIGGAATEKLRAEGAAATAAALGVAAATALRSMELSVVNEELVEALVMRHHHGSREGGGCGDRGGGCGGDGSVLVFLPGVAEIDRLARRLEGRSAELHVVRLHSQLSSTEQRAAFDPPPRPHTTKVVLATDIAETSVTIPDVTLVLDGGLHRLLVCDERASHAPHLRTARISLAAAKQRAGRAGRVRAGVCYHLFCEVETRAAGRGTTRAARRHVAPAARNA